MNATNALIFAALGSVMEFLPRAFPHVFPQHGVDEDSNRALWLSLMGAVQITLGVGFVLSCRVYPAISKVFTTARGEESGTFALPNARSVTGR